MGAFFLNQVTEKRDDKTVPMDTLQLQTVTRKNRDAVIEVQTVVVVLTRENVLISKIMWIKDEEWKDVRMVNNWSFNTTRRIISITINNNILSTETCQNTVSLNGHTITMEVTGINGGLTRIMALTIISLTSSNSVNRQEICRLMHIIPDISGGLHRLLK